MLPKDIQDQVFSMDLKLLNKVGSDAAGFDELRDRVINLATQRMLMHVPVPMDCDHFSQQQDLDCQPCFGD